MKSAGIIGRNGPQSKQPFLVAFFKASEVLLRSVRAAGGKKKSHGRNKGKAQQKSSPAPKRGGTVQFSKIQNIQSCSLKGAVSKVRYFSNFHQTNQLQFTHLHLIYGTQINWKAVFQSHKLLSEC